VGCGLWVEVFVEFRSGKCAISFFSGNFSFLKWQFFFFEVAISFFSGKSAASVCNMYSGAQKFWFLFLILFLSLLLCPAVCSSAFFREGEHALSQGKIPFFSERSQESLYSIIEYE